ncbi:hypothetical protein [Streptomyces sp. NPDC059928]
MKGYGRHDPPLEVRWRQADQQVTEPVRVEATLPGWVQRTHAPATVTE